MYFILNFNSTFINLLLRNKFIHQINSVGDNLNKN